MTEAKVAEKKLINISSKHRINGSTNLYDVYVGSNLSNIKSISLNSLEIANSFYNVNSSYSLTVYIATLLNPPSVLQTTNLGSFTISLPPQQYTATTFATALQDVLNSGVQSIPQLAEVTSLFSVSFSSQTFRLMISMSNSYQQYAFSFYDTDRKSTSKLLNIMGFDSTLATNIVNRYARSRSGTRLVDLRGPTAIYIWSSVSSNVGVDSKSNIVHLLGKIQLTAPFGSTIYYRASDPDIERFNINRNIDVIRLSLRDEDGELLDNQNMEWSLSMMAYL